MLGSPVFIACGGIQVKRETYGLSGSFNRLFFIATTNTDTELPVALTWTYFFRPDEVHNTWYSICVAGIPKPAAQLLFDCLGQHHGKSEGVEVAIEESLIPLCWDWIDLLQMPRYMARSRRRLPLVILNRLIRKPFALLLALCICCSPFHSEMAADSWLLL